MGAAAGAAAEAAADVEAVEGATPQPVHQAARRRPIATSRHNPGCAGTEPAREVTDKAGAVVVGLAAVEMARPRAANEMMLHV